MGWIEPKVRANTYVNKLNGKTYCAYCNKEIEVDAEWDDYDKTEWYHCNCKDALKEIELVQKREQLKAEIKSVEKEISDLQNSAPYIVRPRWVIEMK